MQRLIFFVDSPDAVAFHYEKSCAPVQRAVHPIVEERVDAWARTVATETYGDLHLCHFCEEAVTREAEQSGGFQERASSRRTKPPAPPPLDRPDPAVPLQSWKQDYSRLTLFPDRVELVVKPPLAANYSVVIPLETITKVVVVDWIPLVRRPRVEITHGTGEEEATDEFVPDVREHFEVGTILREAVAAARQPQAEPPPPEPPPPEPEPEPMRATALIEGAGAHAETSRRKGTKAPTLSIDPPTKNVMPGLGWAFTFYVDGVNQVDATWTIDNPDIGTISDGEFRAAEGYRASTAKITATTADGKLSAHARVRILVHRPMSDHIGLIDASSVPGIEARPWNDAQGRRAALLIIDALNQLPKSFLAAVGPVGVVRARDLGLFDDANGIHLPLPGRLVFLSESKLISKLRLEKGITEADERLQRVFIHELAHVVLANRALPDFERWATLVTAALGLAVAPALPPASVGVSLLISPLAIFAAYYWIREDYCTEWSRVSGWVINNPNPFGIFWQENTVAPDVMTGLILFGRHVGLRNPAGKGFITQYARTDAHEDFADSIRVMATDHVLSAEPDFQPRRTFLLKTKAWPRKAKAVVCGKTFTAWADADPSRKAPDMRGWAVYMGLHVTGGPPKGGKRVRAPGAEGVAAATAGPAPPEDDWDAGEGDGVPVDSDVLDDVAALTKNVEKLGPALDAFTVLAAPVLEEANAIVAELPGAPQDPADTLGWLRTAERHGDGLHAVGRAEIDKEGLAVAARHLERRDVLVDADGHLFLVAETGPEGRATRLVAGLVADEDDNHRAPKLEAERFRLVWRPEPAARTWGAPQLDAELGAIIGLWGVDAGRDLSVPGNFVAEVLRATRRSAQGVAELDDADLRGWCEKRGGLRAAAEAPPVAGDVVRLSEGGHWGVCIRPPGQSDAIDVLAMSDEKDGPLGESPDHARMLHAVALRELSHIWRPPPLG